MDDSLIALLTAAVVLSSALVGFIAKLKKDVREIHVMVNSHAESQEDRIDQLAEALRAAGIPIPDRHD